MLAWKDMSDPGKAWQDKKVFPDVLLTPLRVCVVCRHQAHTRRLATVPRRSRGEKGVAQLEVSPALLFVIALTDMPSSQVLL